jgi:hypothetical protein
MVKQVGSVYILEHRNCEDGENDILRAFDDDKKAIAAMKQDFKQRYDKGSSLDFDHNNGDEIQYSVYDQNDLCYGDAYVIHIKAYE